MSTESADRVAAGRSFPKWGTDPEKPRESDFFPFLGWHYKMYVYVYGSGGYKSLYKRVEIWGCRTNGGHNPESTSIVNRKSKAHLKKNGRSL